MDSATYEAAPIEARDPDRPLWVRWGTLDVDEDVYQATLRWLFDLAAGQMFGDALGALLWDAQQLERWNPVSQSWELVA